MKSNAFFTHLRMLCAAVCLMGSVFLFTGCPAAATLCPEKTCNDLHLIATVADGGATITHKLTFTNIGGNYDVVAQDSITNAVLYTNNATTNVIHSFTQPYNTRTVKWTVTARYCTPEQTITCSSFAKVSGGGIAVIVVERTAPDVCVRGLNLPLFSINYSNIAADLPPNDVLYYKGSATASEADILGLMKNQPSLRLTLYKNVRSDCKESVDDIGANYVHHIYVQNTPTAVINKDLNKYIDDLLKDPLAPSPYGSSYSGNANANTRFIRHIQYN